MSLLSGCFGDPPVLGPPGESTGPGPETTSEAAAESSDPTLAPSTSESSGGGEPTTVGSGAEGSSSGASSSSGVPETRLLFSFYDEACGPGVLWFGYNATTMQNGTTGCDDPGPLGFVETQMTAPVASGGDASNVVTVAPTPTDGSSVSGETASLPLTEAVAPHVVMEVDCPGAATSGSLFYQVNLLDLNAPPENQVVSTVAMGTHVCGGLATAIDQPLPTDLDYAIVVFVMLNDDVPGLAAALIDPRIVAE